MQKIEIEAKKEFTLVKERSNPKATWIFPKMELTKHNITKIIIQVLNLKGLVNLGRLQK